MRLIAVALACVTAGATSYSAQGPGASPTLPIAFEVASVKVNPSLEQRWRAGDVSSRLVAITNMPLRNIIFHAYAVQPSYQSFAVVGGPDQILSTHFDITAKIPDDAPVSQRLEMLRTLLAERFKLRIHPETRQVPVFALRVAREGRLGPELRPSTVDCAAFLASGGRPRDDNAPRDESNRPLCDAGATLGPSPGTIAMRYSGTMTELAQTASGFAGRPVVDATGLTGMLAWSLIFSLNLSGSGEIPHLTTAVREQLGLRLESRTGPFEVLVIDSVEMPTPN